MNHVQPSASGEGERATNEEQLTGESGVIATTLAKLTPVVPAMSVHEGRQRLHTRPRDVRKASTAHDFSRIAPMDWKRPAAPIAERSIGAGRGRQRCWMVGVRTTTHKLKHVPTTALVRHADVDRITGVIALVWCQRSHY